MIASHELRELLRNVDDFGQAFLARSRDKSELAQRRKLIKQAQDAGLVEWPERDGSFHVLRLSERGEAVLYVDNAKRIFD